MKERKVEVYTSLNIRNDDRTVHVYVECKGEVHRETRMRVFWIMTEAMEIWCPESLYGNGYKEPASTKRMI